MKTHHVSAEQDGFRDECGVVAVFGHPEAANLAYLALHGLQHRGQESAGIVASESANSTSEAGSLATLLALGIPGGGATAENDIETPFDRLNQEFGQ